MFEVGDIVVCIDNSFRESDLVLKKTYTVTEIWLQNDYLKFEGSPQWWDVSRFQKAENVPVIYRFMVLRQRILYRMVGDV